MKSPAEWFLFYAAICAVIAALTDIRTNGDLGARATLFWLLFAWLLVPYALYLAIRKIRSDAKN